MLADLRIPPSVRRQIGMPAGLITVRFGASSPLDEPGGYRYEIGAEDRRILEQAIADAGASESDLTKQEMARSAIETALGAIPIYGAFLRAGGSMLMNWLGYGVEVELGDVPGAVVVHVKDYTVLAAGWDERYMQSTAAVKSASSSVIGIGLDQLTVTLKAAMSIDAWSYDFRFGFEHRYGFAGPEFGIGRFVEATDSFDVEVDAASPTVRTPEGAVLSSVTTINDPSGVPPHPAFDPNVEYEGLSITMASGFYYRLFGRIFERDENGVATRNERVFFGPKMRIGDAPPFDEFGSGSLEDIGAMGDLDPNLSDIPPSALEDLIDDLKDSPWYDNYAPPPGTTDDDPIDINPGPGPGDIGDPGDGEAPLDPSDPNFPCGPPSGYNLGPGLDNLKMDRGIGKSPYSSFKPPPDATEDDFKPGTPVCLKTSGSSKKCGTVGNYVPPDGPNPGHVGVFHPPRTEDVFTHARCYKNKNAGVIAKELAKELGVDPDVVVDDGCKARFTGCFKKGSSKWDAMWKMADLCGYGIFPPPCDDVLDPNCSGNIGPIRPLPIHHGPYHENRDLFTFSRVYDDTDVPAYVVFWRPPYRGNKGFEIVVKVDTIFGVPEDKWEYNLVPQSTSEHEASVAAARKAASYAMRGMTAEFAVPYNPKILERHQVKVRRPSEGIDINYMAVDIRHDLSQEGWLTVVRGSELKVDRYAPRFEEVY